LVVGGWWSVVGGWWSVVGVAGGGRRFNMAVIVAFGNQSPV
jgi:hypothetical protein